MKMNIYYMFTRNTFLFFFLLLSTLAFSQSNPFSTLRDQYSRLRNEEKFDSALVFAKEMNSWALKNEGDTSLRYAVSFRYIGNCYDAFQNSDSALYYWNKSLETLGKQNRTESLEYCDGLNSIGLFFEIKKDLIEAILSYSKALDIKIKIIGYEKLEIAEDIMNLGILYFETENYILSEKLLIQSMNIKKEILGKEHQKYALSLTQLGILYYFKEDYNKAEFYFKKALEIRKKTLGEYHPDVASCLNNLGDLFNLKGDLKSAEPYYINALEIRKKTLGVNHPDYAISLVNIGDLYSKMGDLKSAEPYYISALEVRKKTLGEDHPDYLILLNSIGILYYDFGDYKSAEPYFKEISKIRKETQGEDHPDYATSLYSLGELYSNMGYYTSAGPYYKEALAIRGKILGEEHPKCVIILNCLGILYSKMGDYKSAEPYFKEVLKIRKKTLGEDHPDYAMILNNLGILYSDMGDFNSAEQYHKKALMIRKKTLGEDHPDYAASLDNLGTLHSKMGDYKSAEQFLKNALEVRKKTLREGRPELAYSYSNLGMLYVLTDDYNSADTIYNKALKIMKSFFGEDNPDYAHILNNLGDLYYHKGDYRSAEPLFKKALEINKKIFGNEHPQIAFNLTSLGNLYNYIGDYKSAETYYKNALEIRIKSLGENHPDIGHSLISLGGIYSNIGNYNKAEQFYDKALNILQKNDDLALLHNHMGVLYSNIGDYKTAEKNYKLAIEIRKKTLKEKNYEYTLVLNNLGNLYLRHGDYNLARILYMQSLEIEKDIISEENTNYDNNLLFSLFIVNSLLKEHNLAFQYLTQSLDKLLKSLEYSFIWLNLSEREFFWNNRKTYFDFINTFSSKIVNIIPEALELSYNANLISKSLLLETSRELDQALLNSKDEIMKSEFEEMKHLRRIVNKMQSEGSVKKEIVEDYRQQADSLDKILVNKLGENAASKRKFEITWKDVQKKLTNTDAAIEFAKYYDDQDSSYNYMALVVRNDYEYPKLVKLGSEESIQKATSSKDFSALYPLVWQGIDSLLNGVKTVYYSPAGELNNVSFSAICFQTGDTSMTIASNDKRTVIESEDEVRSCNAYLMDKYNLHQLTTTRYLADGSLDKEIKLESSITLLGGINYDDLPVSTNDSIRDESNEDFLFRISMENQKSKENNRNSRFGAKMSYLEGTKQEVSKIEKELKKSKWEIKTLTDKTASENNLKKQLNSNSFGILHIATHGFAFPEEKKKPDLMLELNRESNYKASDNPMVRCGLMMNGSNISWTGNPQKMIQETGEDGILTAAEVSNLDLSKTKLVVLSACQTGLGKIEGSEGTFGLKRGFKLAGVEQMIVSLWSVPDKETMELMTLFYADLTLTKNPVISFKKAQKEMRMKYPTEPEKWAGFLLVR
jgi:tetratricopeptide (TPR) repeat protein